MVYIFCTKKLTIDDLYTVGKRSDPCQLQLH